MDLPTYTNIWRIEKRLYKLYDFRLPMPLPISWIAVFCGITVPYVVVLAAIGVPFDHTLLWLYVLPPGVLTWLTTRPVLENKRLPELLVSQLRYLGEPRTWCRLVPLSEKNDIRVYVRVWHRPAGAAAPATDGAAAMAVATTGRVRASGALVVAPGLAARIRTAGRPATEGAGPVGGTQRTWRDGRGRQDLPLRAASAGPPSWPYAEMGSDRPPPEPPPEPAEHLPRRKPALDRLRPDWPGQDRQGQDRLRLDYRLRLDWLGRDGQLLPGPAGWNRPREQDRAGRCTRTGALRSRVRYFVGQRPPLPVPAARKLAARRFPAGRPRAVPRRGPVAAAVRPPDRCPSPRPPRSRTRRRRSRARRGSRSGAGPLAVAARVLPPPVP